MNTTDKDISSHTIRLQLNDPKAHVNVELIEETLNDFSKIADFSDFFECHDKLERLYPNQTMTKEAEVFCDRHLYSLCKDYLQKKEDFKIEDFTDAISFFMI